MARSDTQAPRRPGTARSRGILHLGIRLLLALAWVGFLVAGAAAESGGFEVRAWVDKTEATLEDQIFLTVSVSGQRRLPSDPILPPLPDFSVTKGGSSSQTKIVNGSISTSVEATYLLTPRRAGSFTIGPVRIEKKGRTYQSQPIPVKILPAASSTEERPMAFVTQHVDVQNPYVHQQIVYTFRFLRSVQSVEAQWDPPTFQGFWVEDLGKERQYEKVINGQRYAVTEIKKALYPLSENLGAIEETRLTCTLVVQRGGSQRGMDSFFGDSFFGSRGQTITKNLGAKPIPLDIRPLPEAGRPEAFEGLVGSFVVRAETGQDRLRVGDSTTLTVTVTGNGNLRDLIELSPEEMPGFKVYPDKPSFQVDMQGDTLHGTKVFKKALVPIEHGILEIPPQEVPYFDPEKGSYQIAGTAPIRLTVEENGEKEPLNLVTATALPGSKSSIKILGRDILPIHTGLAGARRQFPSGMSLYATLASLLLPPGIFLACYGRKRRQERLETDQHIVRRKEARKKATRLLREAKGRIHQPADKEYFGELSRSLKGLVGDKLNLNTLACTPVEIERCLLDKGMGEEKAKGVREFLEELEYDQYVSTRLEADEREARYKKAQKLLAQLDKRLQNRKKIVNEPVVNKTPTRLSQAWVLLFLILWIPSSTAQDLKDVHSLLFRANQAYLEDRYEEAAGLYEMILETGHLNGHVFFNLGNTYIRLGELGKALLNYKKASLLLPRDGDLKANLQYARSLATDRIEEASPSLWNTLAFWYFGMNLWELLIAFALLNLLFWSSALFNLYRNSEWAKWTLWLSLLLGLVLGASAGMKATESFRNAGGVLLEDEAPVRAGFSRNDTTLFVLHEGAEFTILDEEQGWWKIALADGKKGWVAAPSGGRVALTRNQPIAR